MENLNLNSHTQKNSAPAAGILNVLSVFFFGVPKIFLKNALNLKEKIRHFGIHACKFSVNILKFSLFMSFLKLSYFFK